MKKLKFASAAAAVVTAALFLGGCGLTAGQNAPSPATSSPSPSAAVSPSAYLPAASPSDGTPASLTLETKSYILGNISIKYPQITGLTDQSKQEALNKLIEQSACRDLDSLKKDADAVDYELTYDVTYNTPDVLSVAFNGYSSMEKAAHPSQFLYTVTLDVKNGKTVKLRNMVAISADFVSTLKSGVYTSTSYTMTDEYRASIKEVLDGLDTDTWLNQLQNADVVGYDESSYLTKDALAVSVSVPHVMGDHVEILLSYKVLAPFRTQGSLLPQ